MRLVNGVTRFGLNKSAINGALIPTAPLPEQQKIAEILTTVDDKISSIEERIQETEQLKKGLMEKLLTEGIGHTEFKDTEIGRVPASWEIQELGEVCKEITTGKLNANAMVPDGPYRFYTCAKKYYRIDKYAFDTEALLVSGNGAHVGYIHYYKGNSMLIKELMYLSGFQVHIKFIQHYLELKLAERIRVEVNAGNMPYITMGTLTEMNILVPPRDEQKQIASILTTVDDKLEVLQSKKSSYDTLKKGLMEQLLTGEMRVKI